MKTKEAMFRLKVLRPCGSGKARTKNAPRLDTLNGKTICEAFRSMYTSGTGSAWRESDTFPVIRELLQKRFPDVKVVPYSDFTRDLSSGEYPYWASPDKIGEVLRAKGCDAILAGNGG